MSKARSLFVASVIIVTVMLSVIAACAQPTSTPTPTPTPTPAPTTAEVIELRYATYLPEAHPLTTRINDAWARDVEAATNGKVKIVGYHAQSLCAAPDTDSAVMTGIADIGWSTTAIPPGRFPHTDAMILPLAPWIMGDRPLALKSQVTQRMYDEGYFGKDFDGMKVLWFYSTSIHHIHSVNKPIRVLEDAKGLKCATTGTGQTDLVNLLGFTGQPVGISEYYLSLQRGVVDAVAFDWVGCQGRKIDEVTEYSTDVPLAAGDFYIVMNLDKWNSLPPDVQQAIDSVSGMAAAKKYGNVANDLDDEGRAYMAERQKEIIVPPAAELERWKDATRPYWDNWIESVKSKGINGQELIDAATKFMNELK